MHLGAASLKVWDLVEPRAEQALASGFGRWGHCFRMLSPGRDHHLAKILRWKDSRGTISQARDHERG